jgi:hypothetical protein
MTDQLTPWQRIVADNYGGGDFAHVQSLTDVKALKGDTLFTFLMVELDPKEDCEDIREALRRVHTAQVEVTHVYNKLVEEVNRVDPT